MKCLITALISAAMLTALPLHVFAEKGPEVIIFKNGKGAVSFHHHSHQNFVADCITCHHLEEKVVPKEYRACRGCHGSEEGEATSIEDALHQKCQGCHEELTGPTKCRGCHDKFKD